MSGGNVIPWIVQVRQIFSPRSNSLKWSTAIYIQKHTKDKISYVIDEANASVNPAVEALMLGVTKHTKPVTPITTAESKLKRTESQRFTMNGGES